MQLDQLGETWPDDVTVLSKVLDQKDPVTRHVAATVLALGADHDPAVREQLCRVRPLFTPSCPRFLRLLWMRLWLQVVQKMSPGCRTCSGPTSPENAVQAGVINTLVGMLGAWEEALAADAAHLLRFLAREAPAR